MARINLLPWRAERRRLGQCRQVVGQAHQAQGVDRHRIAGEVAHPRSRERERLAHGAGDQQARATLEQRQRTLRAPIGELEVGLIDHDHAAGGIGDGANRLE